MTCWRHAGPGALFLCSLVILACSEGGKKKEDKREEAPVTEKVGLQPIDPESSVMRDGKEVYTQYCLVCHQVKGGGVSGLNPPLKGTEYVLGEPAGLIGIILNGSNKGLPVNGVSYSNAMPGFSHLGDEEIASVATYIRNSFGNAASPVRPEEVALLRQKQ